ncbi:hypothetical protein D3Z55_01195 [Clostridiaceae bacterium]|nr:hypothetical protein [Clostridiaceae bacterium]
MTVILRKYKTQKADRAKRLVQSVKALCQETAINQLCGCFLGAFWDCDSRFTRIHCYCLDGEKFGMNFRH